MAINGFFTMSALTFAACAALTAIWSASMSAMGGMPMPGGWTMSMAWMRMPGQTWPGAAASFLGMWVVMMVPMMLPSLIPMLRHYREAAARRDGPRLDRLTAIVAAGYFFVWTVLGLVAYPPGVALAEIAMQRPPLSRAVPIAAGVAVVVAGALQFSAWKARQLSRFCTILAGGGTGASDRETDGGTAWRCGVRLGWHCARCCSNLMAIFLVIGVMDLHVMAVVTAAITLERLAPVGDRAARVIGGVAVAAGVLLIARAAVLG
jgi:predicted metal-binding membrane protein